VSLQVFPRGGRHRRNRDYKHELQQIGQSGELISKARETLVSLSRLLGFLQQTGSNRVTTEARASLRTVARDVVALSDHATFLVGKAQFLLDATLGMVTIDRTTSSRSSRSSPCCSCPHPSSAPSGMKPSTSLAA
jgi:magnesium transporter